MMTVPRSPASQDVLDVLLAMSEEELMRLVHSVPVLAYAFARQKSKPDDPLTVESMARDALLIRHFPRSVDYYKSRAEEERWRKPKILARGSR